MRERWSSRTIFLFAAIGSAVGLGNVWRFPYLTFKFGGGAFLLPYLIALLLIGIPMLMLEFAVGQKLQKGAVGSFSKINPKLSGVGLAAIIAGSMVAIYYAAVMAWSLLFAFNSLKTDLPWRENPSDFFYKDILALTASPVEIGSLVWPLFIGLFIVWVLVYFAVFKGVKSVGKVVMVTMPLPILLLIVLFARGITLDGAMLGISAYLTPDFNALLDPEIWLAAISQIFFTLSLAFGIMIAYASFNNKNQDIKSDSITTALVNSAISIFAGFVVFAILGFMAQSTGQTLDEVAAGGPGLVYVVFPKALSLMPWPQFFSFLFFITLLALGIDSLLSLVEALNTALGDRYNLPNRPLIALYVCIAGFLLGTVFVTGAGLYYLDIVDHFVTNYGLILVGILQSIAIGWFYGADKLRSYINSTGKSALGKWWNFSIKYFIPLTLSIFLLAQFIKDLNSPYEGYAQSALALGWLAFGIIVIALVKGLVKTKDSIRGRDT